MQALELEARDPGGAGEQVDGGERVGIVGGEAGIDGGRGREHGFRAGEVVNVRTLLCGEDREVRIAFDLGVLDFGIPVGALDEADHEAAAGDVCQRAEALNDGESALLVGLHREAEAGPVFEGGLAGEFLEDLEADDQAVGFLGVEAEADIGFRGLLAEGQHFRIHLGHHARFLHGEVARVEGGELDRDAVGGFGRQFRVLVGGDGGDRVFVGLEVAGGVGAGAGALPQHVEGEVGGLAGLHHAAAALQGFLDRPSKDELFAHDAHRLHHGGADDRLAALADQAADEGGRALLGAVRRADDAAGEHQAPGGGVDEPGVRLALVGAPVAGADLLGDQVVAGGGVRHAQQRFGEAHQGEAFGIGQAELLEEAFHHAFAAALGAGEDDQFAAPAHGAFADRPGQHTLLDQAFEEGFFIGEFQRVERVPVNRERGEGVRHGNGRTHRKRGKVLRLRRRHGA